MVKAMRACRDAGFDGPMVEDHVPEMAGGPDQWPAKAFRAGLHEGRHAGGGRELTANASERTVHLRRAAADWITTIQSWRIGGIPRIVSATRQSPSRSGRISPMSCSAPVRGSK